MIPSGPGTGLNSPASTSIAHATPATTPSLVQTEETARGSLANRRAHNSKAAAVLVNSLLAQHRYPEALAAARDLAALEPDARSVRALLGEIEMELGQYDSARATFTWLAGWTRDLAVRPTAGAVVRARRTRRRRPPAAGAGPGQCPAAPDSQAEQAAWFELRVGDIALRNGRLAEAEKAFRAGLGAHAGDYRLLGNGPPHRGPASVEKQHRLGRGGYRAPPGPSDPGPPRRRLRCVG